MQLSWKNKLNPKFTCIMLKLRLYLNFSFFMLLVGIIIALYFAKKGDLLFTFITFCFLFFDVNRYIKSVNFKILIVKFAGPIAKIDFKKLDTLISIDNQILECTITDILCANAIKTGKLSFTGGSYICGMAYGLIRGEQTQISHFKIYHVQEIGVIRNEP